MLVEQPDELDELIEQEKRRVASDLLQEGWDSARREGIEGRILAERAVTLALTNLMDIEGEASVERLVESLPDRLLQGDFLARRVLQ